MVTQEQLIRLIHDYFQDKKGHQADRVDLCARYPSKMIKEEQLETEKYYLLVEVEQELIKLIK